MGEPPFSASIPGRASRRLARTPRWPLLAVALVAGVVAASARAGRLDDVTVPTTGSQKFKVKGVDKTRDPFALDLAFAANGGLALTDVGGTTLVGVWSKRGRKVALQLSQGGIATLQSILDARVAARLGPGAAVSLRRIDLKAKLDRKKTRLKVKAKIVAEASDGGTPRKVVWKFATKGALPPRTGTGAFDVGGLITAAESSFTDSDLNDAATTPVPNDSTATAQSIPVPATVGGYVNEPFSGFPGNSFVTGDVVDVYRVQLAEGTVIALAIGEDPAFADLDLALADEDGFLLDESAGTDNLEILEAPGDGTFFVAVYTYEPCLCGSTYVLTVGQPVPAAALARGGRGARLSDEFAAGEVLVTARRGTLPASSAQTASAGSLARTLGMHAAGGAAGREMRLRFADPASRTAALSAAGLDRKPTDRAPGLRPPRDPALFDRWETLHLAKRLRGRSDVATADLNYIRRPKAVPNDEFFGLQWHYPLINLPQAWDVTTGSADVVVAVIDTGVLLSHPDLQGQLVAGYDFISDPSNAVDGDGIDPDPDDPGDGAFGESSSFHGTHVAGTIAAATDNGSGVAGVAWDARVMPLRVLGSRGGTDFDIIQAVRFAAGLPNDSGTVPPVPAGVMNLSLGGAGFSQTAQNAFTAARQAGAIIVAAAGNESTSRPSFPAAYDGVVSVSAVDLNRDLTRYSNFGPSVDVAAPGGDTSVDRNGDGFGDGVLSTAGDDSAGSVKFEFAFENGTSMASPHVAGVVALMRAVAPGMTPDQFDGLLDGTLGTITQDLGAPGRDDRFGHGLIDARAAVLAARELAGGPPPAPEPRLRSSPTALNFATDRSALPFALDNAGDGALSVTDVSDDEAWLQVAASEVDGDGLGTYTATVDRTGLADGLYRATITARSSANTVEIAVVMRVGAAVASDTGPQYILLIDAATFVPVAQVDVSPADGTYDYAFAGVPAGTYFVLGGTDLDNDGFVCHGGEACGGYPALDLLTPVEVRGDRDDLDFSTGFLQTIGVLGPAGRAELPERGIPLATAHKRSGAR